MKLNAVMDEIAAHLQTIPDLRVYAWPVGKVVGPAAVVLYPETKAYDLTYGRGTTRFNDLQVLLVHPRPDDLATRRVVAGWSDDAGPTSIKTVIERGPYASCDDVTVTECAFSVVTYADTPYMAAIFSMTVTGNGA